MKSFIFGTINKKEKMRYFCFGTLDGYIDIIIGIIYKCIKEIPENFNASEQEVREYIFNRLNKFYKYNFNE